MNKQEALEKMLAAARMHEQPDGMASEPQREKAASGLVRTTREAVRQLAAAENADDATGQALHKSGTDMLIRAGGMILAMLTDEEG